MFGSWKYKKNKTVRNGRLFHNACVHLVGQGRRASTPRKERRRKDKWEEQRRKGIEAQRLKHSTPSQATDVPRGDEEQKGKRKEETESGSPTQLPWIIQSPPTTRRHHTMTLFVLPTRPTGHIYIYMTYLNSRNWKITTGVFPLKNEQSNSTKLTS